jgi:hypothetical protein
MYRDRPARAHDGASSGASSSVGPNADVVAFARPPRRPVRDGVDRVGAMAPMDSQNRVCIRKVLARLGWDESTPLVAVVDGLQALVCEGVAATAAPRRPRTVPQGHRRTQPTITPATSTATTQHQHQPWSHQNRPCHAHQAVALVRALLVAGIVEPGELSQTDLAAGGAGSPSLPRDQSSLVPETPIRLFDLRKKALDGLSKNTRATYRTYLELLVDGGR